MPGTESQAASAISTDNRSFTLDVTSETGALEQVIVHTPGHEMDLVAPEDREDLLFEDILYLSHARREHHLMCSVFQKAVGSDVAVLQLDQLLRESLEVEDARQDLVDRLCRIAYGKNLQAFEDDLKRLSAEELYNFALTGDSPFRLDWLPLPNLMFARDLAAVVGSHVVISHPATAARAREGVIISIVLDYHPGFASSRDNIIRLPEGVTFEGGDLLVLSPESILIGSSERTSFGGVMTLARALFERTDVSNVILVNLPHRRSYMHLDTIFTFVSQSECVVFPPIIDLTDLGNVVHLRRIDKEVEFSATIRSNLKTALETVLDRSLTYIPCGGDDPLSQKREQWTDGANFFALAPGVVIGYERNEKTFDAMAANGYRVVTVDGFLAYHSESAYQAGGEKLAIKLEGHELSRGRGGPRCMTLPLRRARV